MAALNEVDPATGPFNIYNYYDNCGGGNQMMTWKQHMEEGREPNPTFARPIRRTLSATPAHGGEAYACGTGAAAVAWANTAEV